ncbi:AAA family ATPase [Rhizobium sp. Rhizsp42]|uniref:AAA family ATPase n=1 Tax=Rhizobium sp. Rhizsp42 TaxID=3243034 RepID=UPI0039B0EC27
MNFQEKFKTLEQYAAEQAARTPSLPVAVPHFHTDAFESDEERVAASKLPVTTRQWMIKNLLVKYRVFKDGYDIIAGNHFPVEGGMPGAGTVGAMLGESRTGKTAVCSYYAAMHPPHYDEEGEIFPVVHMTATVKMTPVEFAHQLNRLTAARYEKKSGGSGVYVDSALLRLLKVQTQLLIIDDAQYLFFDRTDKTAANMFKLVKAIIDYDCLAVMLVGEERINDYVFSIRPFANRQYNWKVLKPLSAGQSDMERFAKLLGSIDRRLPFANLSGLDQTYIAEQFYRYSGGMIGRVMNIIEPAAYIALNKRAASVTIEHLREAVSTRVDAGDSYSYFGYLRHAA